ncbi:MAG: hypothetical protein AABW80_04270 [Nanoarchaeota archaeon]
MGINLGQIEGTIRSFIEALKKNPLTEEEKEYCRRRIKELEKMKENYKRKNK